MPTSALEGEWLAPLLEATGDATVVCPQPGVHVLERVGRFVPPQQVVSGEIGFIAYQAPLPGEALDPGTAYYFPPLSPCRFHFRCGANTGEWNSPIGVTTGLKLGGRGLPSRSFRSGFGSKV